MKLLPLIGIFTFCAAAAAPACFGQTLLDQQLGNKTSGTAGVPQNMPPAGQPAKPDVVTPATPPGVSNDIVSPDAAKKVDDQDLIHQLIQPGNDKPTPQQTAQQLKTMLDRMGQSEHRLADKDPGEVTQETQRRIVSDLDVMIEMAKKQQQGSSGSPQPQQGQQRQPSQGQPQPANNEGGNQAATHENLPHGPVSDAATGDMHNHDPANWGALPPRDRDQISHGANEEYLSLYRDAIDRYYQALAELGKSHSR